MRSTTLPPDTGEPLEEHTGVLLSPGHLLTHYSSSSSSPPHSSLLPLTSLPGPQSFSSPTLTLSLRLPHSLHCSGPAAGSSRTGLLHRSHWLQRPRDSCRALLLVEPAGCSRSAVPPARRLGSSPAPHWPDTRPHCVALRCAIGTCASAGMCSHTSRHT